MYWNMPMKRIVKYPVDISNLANKTNYHCQYAASNFLPSAAKQNTSTTQQNKTNRKPGKVSQFEWVVSWQKQNC